MNFVLTPPATTTVKVGTTMPRITIEAMPKTLNLMQKESLKGFLREACTRLFSAHQSEVQMADISFSFPELGEGSDLSHDVIVRIRVQAMPERLQFSSMHALELQQGAADTIVGADSQHRDVHVAVSIDYGTEMTWCDDNGIS